MSPSPLRSHLVVPLTRRFRLALAHIDAQSTPKLVAAWSKLPAYDEANVARFEREARTALTTAKNATVHHSVGYYSMLAGIRPLAIQPADIPVEPDTRGPFIQTWSALKHGDTFEGAVAAGASRVEAMVTNFISSASRQTGGEALKRVDVVVGWSRDPEPGACDWCLEAATTTYSSAEATDFGHDRCQCLGVPAF